VKVTLTARARRDLDEIGDYMADESPKRAEAFVEALTQRCLSLTENPERGQRIGARMSDLRRLTHGRYLVIYAVRTDSVVIERVLHGARDLSTIFGDDLD
jgi:addiction module RelE/StbE family toxin